MFKFETKLSAIERCTRSYPESPFSAPVREKWIAPAADCKAKETLVTKNPAFAAEKPRDLLLSLPCPPYREPSKPISPTPVTQRGATPATTAHQEELLWMRPAS
jgi:hypothetical protein